MIENLRELPGPDIRVETGPVQFGDDWPGVFIRGDNAFAYALALEQVLAADPPEYAGLWRIQAEGIVALLRSCIVGPARDMHP